MKLARLREAVNLLGGLAVNSLSAAVANRRTNVRLVVQCMTKHRGDRGEDMLQVASKRSVKYMEGVLMGAWVLSPEWVDASLRAGHWLPEAHGLSCMETANRVLNLLQRPPQFFFLPGPDLLAAGPL